jgi:uncharacterized membrane protein YtjA (UPF0391 family)
VRNHFYETILCNCLCDLGTIRGVEQACAAQEELTTPHLLCSERNELGKEIYMLNWALAFFLIAILAAVLGFGGIAFAAAGIAKILFVIFLVLFLVSLIAHVARRA